MDSRKCQTSTATPAQPGDFPLWFNQLTTQTLGDFEIALPPEKAQVEIVNHLDKATTAIDAQCRKAQTVIDRLTEYRGALITNAVTGKIDVRGFAIPQIAEGIGS